jgi:hypothetical protein
MKIDVSKMRCIWWEDERGNVLELEAHRVPTEKEKEKYRYYHSEFPCQLSHHISVYDYHSKGIQKLLIKLPIIGKRIKKKIGKTFEDVCTFNTTYRGGSDCIVAMVNSGDYTLEQAIWVYANSCERCMNALCFKYLDGKEGYEEYSDEWVECNTVCDFCKGE